MAAVTRVYKAELMYKTGLELVILQFGVATDYTYREWNV